MAGGAIGALITVLLAIAAQIGTFAYYGLRPEVTARITSIAPGNIDIVQYRLPQRTPITNYVPVAGARLHVFVIRDDFQTFTHLHPTVGAHGHFTVPVHLDRNHRYYAYVDSFVSGVGEQALRFTLQSGAPPHHLDVALAQPAAVSHAGPYTVRLSSARFTADSPITLSTTVTRGSRMVVPPAGRSFQAVATLINTGTLGYTAFYEGNAAGLVYPGEYDHPQLRLPPLPAGVYRMWLQIEVNNKRYTAPFTLAAQ